MNTSRIYVSDNYIRAARGGTGYAKVGGNYGNAMRASADAMKVNCKDVLWLDAAENKYVEEIGTSNAFFRIDNEVITAPLTDGTILPGITRRSVIELLKSWGEKVSERRLSIDEITEASGNGKLQEIFASGTAAAGKKVTMSGVGGKNATKNVRADLKKLLDFIKTEVICGEGNGFAADGTAFQTDVLTLNENELSVLEKQAEEFLKAI